MSVTLTDHYLKRVDALDNALRSCIATSQRLAGIRSATGRHFYASVLFTTLCTRAVSLATLAPHSPWAERKIEHWDFASIAGLTRSILEVRLAFFYLCGEKCSPEEWDCRWNIFNLHDCVSRMCLFESMSPESGDIEGFSVQAEELRGRLTGNSYFMALPEKQRNKLLKGANAYLYPLEDLAQRTGVEIQTFRWLYRLLSSQLHGLPLSFYRMGEQEQGRGVHSEVEEGYTSLCLSLCVSFLVAARDEMERLFSQGDCSN